MTIMSYYQNPLLATRAQVEAIVAWFYAAKQLDMTFAGKAGECQSTANLYYMRRTEAEALLQSARDQVIAERTLRAMRAADGVTECPDHKGPCVAGTYGYCRHCGSRTSQQLD
jgi:hypothetical protein